MKNWKSLVTWLLFAVSYNYAVYTDKPEPIVYTTGLFTIVMGIVFIFRTDMTRELVSKLIENILNRSKY